MRKRNKKIKIIVSAGSTLPAILLAVFLLSENVAAVRPFQAKTQLETMKLDRELGRDVELKVDNATGKIEFLAKRGSAEPL
jgi:hypothetical protein